MQQNENLKVDTLKVPKDERTEIFEAGSPSLNKETLKKDPKITIHHEHEETKGTIVKSIREYKSYGQGTIEFLACRFDPEDLLVATAAADGMIHIYPVNIEGDKHPTVLNAAEMPGTPITCLRWRPHTGLTKTKQVLVSSCADGSISHWHVPSGKLLHRIMEKDNQVLCLDYNKDGTTFASAGKDRSIRIYDENTKSLITEMSGGIWQHPGHSNRIFTIKYHPEDSNIIVSAGWDNTIFFWDVREGRTFGSIYGPAISGDALDIKGNHILTGSWRNRDQLELWDYSSKKKIRDIHWEKNFTPDNVYIYGCQFSKKDDESIIAGSSHKNEVKIFDINKDYSSFGKIGDLSRGVYSVDYANNQDLFAFCGGDGHCHIVQILSSLKEDKDKQP